MDFRFILCDPKKDLCNEWRNALNVMLTPQERSHFCIHHGYLQDVKETFDCIVSPANSYARLDGSFDAVISKMFSPSNEEAVIDYCQDFLHAVYNGYQPPGTALLIPMQPFGDNLYECKYIAHCPTMRTPSNCRWNREVVYNCMWTLLCELRRHNAYKKNFPIKTIFVTGLGTGIGRFPSEVCARQMILAYKHFVRNLTKPNKTTSWREANDDALDIEETNRTMSFLQ